MKPKHVYLILLLVYLAGSLASCAAQGHCRPTGMVGYSPNNKNR